MIAKSVLGLVTGVAVAAGTLGPASAQLAVDAPVSGKILTAGETRTVGLTAAAGDYIEGVLETGSEPFDLRLLDADGAPVRRLRGNSTGRGAFYFVVEAENPVLRLTAQQPGSFNLSITRRLSAAEQVTPPPAYLSPTMAEIASELARGGTADAFWARVEREGTPLVEPSGPGEVVMTFLARGAERNVRMFGAPSSDHEAMERLGDSDIWFKSFTVPESTRLSYQIAPDVPDFPGTARQRRVAILARAQVDPYNLHPWPADAPDRFNQESVVELPGAPPQPGVEPSGAPEGRIQVDAFDSARLGNRRQVAIYTPAGFDPADPRAVLLITFDGRRYRSKIPTPTILDNLIAAGTLPPVVAVFVANPDQATRARELPANRDFADMLADELVPWVAARTGLAPIAARTALVGSSYGGLAAASAALFRPDRFGNALSLSGSFWWHPADAPEARSNYVADFVAHHERLPVRFFLSAGLFERDRGGWGGILENTRHLRDVLEAKGYPVVHREYATAHDFYAWRGALGDGLLALFGSRP